MQIKLIGTEREKAKTLYWLMSNGKTKCFVEDIIIIDEKLFNKLKKHKGLSWDRP